MTWLLIGVGQVVLSAERIHVRKVAKKDCPGQFMHAPAEINGVGEGIVRGNFHVLSCIVISICRSFKGGGVWAWWCAHTRKTYGHWFRVSGTPNLVVG